MPAIAYGQPTWIDAVLDLVEARVSAVASLPRERVFSYAGEPDKLAAMPHAEQFVTAWFVGMPPIAGIVAGGGAAHTAFDSTLRLDVFVRIGTDREMSDSRLLRDRSFGFAGLVRKVVKAVQVWGAEAADNTSPFIEPARLVSPGISFNPRTPPTGWAWARAMLGVKFRTDFTV